MIYLYGYFGVGVFVLLAMYVSHRISVKSEPDIHEILDSLDPNRGNWDHKLIEKFIAPLLGITIGPLMWPLFIYWKAGEIFSQPGEKTDIPADEGKEPVISRSNLIVRMTLPEIEGRERVIDPLGAVPDVPFGHLNSAWEKFKLNFQDGDEIWTFTSLWNLERTMQDCKGYAILRSNKVPHYFLTGWRDIELTTAPARRV